MANRLPRRDGRGIVGPVPAHRTPGSTSDSLKAAATHGSQPKVVAPKVEVAPAGKPSLPRYLLPSDLPAAVARLSESDLDRLLAAVIEEAKRRGRLPSPPTAGFSQLDRQPHDVPSARTPAPPGASHLRQIPGDDGAPSLTQGQMNAFRAAFKAGVKPAMIARQFGISLSIVKKVLALGARGRKS